MGTDSTELVQQFLKRVDTERLTPGEVENRTGVSEPTLRRWRRLIDDDESVSIRTRKQRAIEAFLAAPDRREEPEAFDAGVRYAIGQILTVVRRLCEAHGCAGGAKPGAETLRALDEALAAIQENGDRRTGTVN